jgi:hypothetical protein
VHGSVLHGVISLVRFVHDWATPSGDADEERERELVPPLHAAEQLPHAPQPSMTQSVQGNDKHGTSLARTGHSRPPARERSITSRWRFELPDAHAWSQTDHAPQLLILQSTGQVSTIVHVSTSLVKPHATPPFDSREVVPRIRLNMPEPHVTEHVPQACQALITQSMGHASVEHWRVCTRVGQATPPSLAAVEIVRSRLVVPPVPQLTVHAAHACHVLTEQSTGHAKALHWALCSVSGQGVPPPVAGCKIVRVREVAPLSQVRVHATQEPQTDTVQLLDGVGVVGMNVGSLVGESVRAAVGGS